MKLPTGSAQAWAGAAMDELQRAIDADRDSQRWEVATRALNRVRDALAEIDKIAESAGEIAIARGEAAQAEAVKKRLDRRQLKLHW